MAKTPVRRIEKRNHGSLQLARLGITQEEIADRIGVNQSQVARWISGERLPGAAMRRSLQSTFGIAAAAWDQEIPKPAEPPRAAAMQSLPEALDESVTQKAKRLAQSVDEIMARVASEPGRTDEERTKVLRACATTLQMLGRLTGEISEIGEDKILRTPAWRRIETRLVAVLERHPEALREVALALKEMGEG